MTWQHKLDAVCLAFLATKLESKCMGTSSKVPRKRCVGGRNGHIWHDSVTQKHSLNCLYVFPRMRKMNLFFSQISFLIWIIWICKFRSFLNRDFTVCIYLNYGASTNYVDRTRWVSGTGIIIIILLLLSKALFQTYWRTVHWSWSENLLGSSSSFEILPASRLEPLCQWHGDFPLWQ